MTAAEQTQLPPFAFVGRDLRFYGDTVAVTPQQSKIMQILAAAQGHYVDRNEIATALGVTDNNIKVQVCLMRKRMREANVPCPIQTRYVLGMRWDVTHFPLPAFTQRPAPVSA